MKVAIIVAALCCVALPALAQQPSPEVQVLSNKVMQELQAELSCSINLAVATQELAKANDRIKALETALKVAQTPQSTEPVR